MQSNLRTSLALGLLWLCIPSPARAGNDDELFVGNQAALSGGAVLATVSDASATWYNPSGLGSIDRNQVDVSGTVYMLRLYSAPGMLTSTTGESDDASIVEFLSVPSQVAYARRLRPGLSLGLGYFAPQATNLLLRESLTVRSGESSGQWQFSLASARVQHTFVAALGGQLSRAVQTGASLVGTYESSLQSTNIASLFTQSEHTTHFRSLMAIGSVQTIGVELVAGFQVQLGEKLRLGVAGRSARLLLHQSTNYTLASGAADAPSGELAGLLIEPKASASGVHVLRAGRLGAGLAFYTGRRDWLAVELDVQPKLRDQDLGIDRQTVVNARLGAYHRMTDALALGAGIFSDRSPDRPSRDAINAWGNFYGATLGLELRDRHWLAPSERADSLTLSSTFALRYAFSSGYMNDLLVDPRPSASSDFASTRGRIFVHELSLYVGGGLRF